MKIIVGTAENKMRYLHPREFITKYPKRASKKAPDDQAKVRPMTNLLRREEGRNSAHSVIIYKEKNLSTIMKVWLCSLVEENQ